MKTKEKEYIDEYLIVGHSNCTCSSGMKCSGEYFEVDKRFDYPKEAQDYLNTLQHPDVLKNLGMEDTVFKIVHLQFEKQ